MWEGVPRQSQSMQRAARALPTSDVSFRRLDVVALLELLQPRIGLCRRDVQPCPLIRGPGLDYALPERFALFFSRAMHGALPGQFGPTTSSMTIASPFAPTSTGFDSP